MKCFFYFKDRNRNRERKSAPVVLQDQSKSDISGGGTERVTKSSCSTSSGRSFSDVYEGKAQNLRVFTFSELKQATNNFNRLLKIGEGGFGCVYKGNIKPADGKGESTIVAIKKLNRDGYQGHKQWVAEVQFLGVVDHPNLVKLIGYCAVDGERGIQRLLVYEFMSNKSLEDHLFNTAFPVLSCQRRLQIALGAAQGLAYLHEELEVQVIYRDFKSSNVLLDDDFKPKLSDFGLAREGPTGMHTHVSTAVSKSDVWSFGVVLYEILTGRRSLERNRPKSEHKLLDWVKRYPADSRKFGMLMDPRLENQYSLDAARKMAKLADTCVLKSAKDRPKMSQVVETLKQIIQISGENTSSVDTSFQNVDDDPVVEEEPKQMGATASAKRRMAHLAKLSENVGGISRRRFMIMQKAKVT
ncbi:putative receptor-like protein kinase [Capsicum baccatum]|uniref:non-specific serine/threonine protein kinase n=1 Tax=Capsicum baccatum TaxID=33114 RepID=A0A2G2XT29_CAPBA|nr:putative receptor-like protein kinase [Capsicum baccatum]